MDFGRAPPLLGSTMFSKYSVISSSLLVPVVSVKLSMASSKDESFVTSEVFFVAPSKCLLTEEKMLMCENLHEI